MIEEIKQILGDSFTYNLPGNELHQAAVDIDELVRARTLPVYLRLCTVEWSLRLAMNNLASFREEPVAQQVNLKEFYKKEYCKICRRITKWEFVDGKQDQDGRILSTIHKCLGCHEALRKFTGIQEFCKICEKITEWTFYCHQRDEGGMILFTLHNCVECGGSKDLGRKDEV